MSHKERLALEIAKETACLEDLYMAADAHTKRGDLRASAECGRRIIQTATKIEQMKVQLRDNKNFHWVINNLRERGLGDIADKIVQAQPGGEQLAHQN